MLLNLGIRNIVLIEELDLDFADGLSVLTGETGAGKSILLDALGFALGRKTRRDLLRAGADQGAVTAVFACNSGHPVFLELEKSGFPTPSDEILLRRTINASGRTSAFVNDQRAGAEALARIGAQLVEVHGQHDDQSLLNPRAHRALFDRTAEIEGQADKVSTLWATFEVQRATLDKAQRRLEAARASADFLRHATDELAKLDPRPGEDAALDTERRLIQAAARIGEDAARAAAELSTEGAEGAMTSALSRLTHIADKAEGTLDTSITALDRAIAELQEAQSGIAHALEAMRCDPGRLETVEDRLFAIRGLARKHQVQPDELASLSADFAARLDAINANEEQVGTLAAELAKAEAAYDAAAQALSTARKAAAAEVDARVTAELAPLKMDQARFSTLIEPAEPGPFGVDRVSFTAATDPGATGAPIDRIASGGELSRFLLALKVCFTAGTERVMIFDEIDRGIGGATAAAVGRRLARLAEGAQVLVVTHSPQVAAEGAHHWRVAKATGDDVARTDVAALNPQARIAEIARMLAGDKITPEARSAARALTAAARRGGARQPAPVPE